MGTIEEWFGRHTHANRGFRWIVYVVLAVTLGIPLCIWARSILQARGIRVEPFSVSQNFSQTNLSGEAVAELLVSKLNEAYEKAKSRHYVQSLNDDIADEIKIEIPETGTTFGDINRYLRDLFGHETHVIGVVYEAGSDLRMNVIVGARTCSTSSALSSNYKPDLDSMMEQLTSCVLAETQPYLGAIYQAKLDRARAEKVQKDKDKAANDSFTSVINHPLPIQEQRDLEKAREALVSADAAEADRDRHNAEIKARAVYESLTSSTDPVERAWAYAALGDGIAKFSQDNPEAIRYGTAILYQATSMLPDFAIAETDIATHEAELGHDEAAAAAQAAYVSILRRGSSPDLSEKSIAELSGSASAQFDVFLGDFQSASRAFSGADCFDPNESCASEIKAVAETHDILLAKMLLARRELPLNWEDALPMESQCRDEGFLDNNARWGFDNARFRFEIAFAEENWREVLESADGTRASYYNDANCVWAQRIDVDPYVAIAVAELGDQRDAEKVIRATPTDCYRCMIARARIYALGGKLAAARFWLEAALGSGNRLPFALQAWGEILLADDARRKGKHSQEELDGAIRKFAAAHRRSPHFADATEKWGEALMAQNRSDLALSEFEEASEFAPNWGRLHLKWGEVLIYTGKKEAGNAQLNAAAGLYLTLSERAELNAITRSRHG